MLNLHMGLAQLHWVGLHLLFKKTDRVHSPPRTSPRPSSLPCYPPFSFKGLFESQFMDTSLTMPLKLLNSISRDAKPNPMLQIFSLCLTSSVSDQVSLILEQAPRQSKKHKKLIGSIDCER